MKLNRNRILLGVYIIGLFVFFLYICFPSDSIRTYLANRLSNMSPQIRVMIERVKPALPPGIRLFNVQLYHRENFWGSIENIKIIPSLLSLFGSETAFSFQGNAYAGEIKGKAEIGANSPAVRMMVDTTLSGIQVKDVEAIQDVSDYKISGILNATMAYTTDARNRTMKGNLALSDCRLDLAVPFFNQDLLTFRDVQAEVLLNNQTLTIKRCNIAGNELDANNLTVFIADRCVMKVQTSLLSPLAGIKTLYTSVFASFQTTLNIIDDACLHQQRGGENIDLLGGFD